MTDIEIGSVKHTGELTEDFLQSMQEHGYPVWFRWMFVTVQYSFVDGAIADLKRRGRAGRKQLLKQVEKSLDSFFEKYPEPVANNEQTPEEIQDFQDACNDVGIWFSEQVRTGKRNDMSESFDDFEKRRKQQLN